MIFKNQKEKSTSIAQKKTNQKIFAFFFQSLVTIIHESFMGIYGHSCFRKAYF